MNLGRGMWQKRRRMLTFPDPMSHLWTPRKGPVTNRSCEHLLATAGVENHRTISSATTSAERATWVRGRPKARGRKLAQDARIGAAKSKARPKACRDDFGTRDVAEAEAHAYVSRFYVPSMDPTKGSCNQPKLRTYARDSKRGEP